jgi:hypothetical protein
MLECPTVEVMDPEMAVQCTAPPEQLTVIEEVQAVGESFEEEERTITEKSDEEHVSVAPPTPIEIFPEIQPEELIPAVSAVYRAQQVLIRMKAVDLVDQIARETIATAENETIPPLDPENQNVFELEPVDIFLPRSVPGMLKSGTVVAGPLEMVGKSIEHTTPDEWIIDEVDDIEETHVFNPTHEKAAKRIQKFFRRYRTRKMLEIAVQRAIQEIRNDIRSDEPINTDNPNCVIM